MKRIATIAVIAALNVMPAVAKDIREWFPKPNAVEKAAWKVCQEICKETEFSGPCERCIEENTGCIVTIISKVPMVTGPDGTPYDMGDGKIAMSTPGEKYLVTGTNDLKFLCKHGGLCIPTSAVKFDKPCTYQEGRGWERIDPVKYRICSREPNPCP
jgi:hypothetical protein